MGHGPNDGNATGLLQRKSRIVVLQKHNGLLVQVPSNLLGCSIVNQAAPLAFWCRRVWVLKEAHLKLDAQESGNGSVDSCNIELARLDQLGDLLEVAVEVLAYSIANHKSGLDVLQ